MSNTYYYDDNLRRPHVAYESIDLL